MPVKSVTTIVVILLLAISFAQLLRIILQVEFIAAGFHVPVWLSVFGVIIPALLAFLLWRENKK